MGTVKNGTEEGFHETGALRFQATYANGLRHGISRTWHKNGVLATEGTYVNGALDGTVRHWNEKSDLLGSFEMKNGTGLTKQWYPNGQLYAEISMVNGSFTGRQRVWFEDGEFVTSVFYIRNRKVSKKKYVEACKTDPALPRYDEPEAKSWETKMKQELRQKTKAKRPAPNGNERELHEKVLKRLLDNPAKAEARDWLRASSLKSLRTLGELENTEDSLALVNEIYEAGAPEVLAVEIGSYGDGAQNTGKLLIRLPGVKKSRRKVFAWCNEQNAHEGFDPDQDFGQDYVLVGLD